MTDGQAKMYPVSEDEPTEQAEDATLQVHGATVHSDGTVEGGSDDGPTERPAAEQPNLQIELSELADGDWIDTPIRVPDGDTLNLYGYGCLNDSGNTPAGLEVALVDIADGSTIVSENTAWTEGSPVASVSGPASVFFRLSNNTGATEIAGAEAAYLKE